MTKKSSLSPYLADSQGVFCANLMSIVPPEWTVNCAFEDWRMGGIFPIGKIPLRAFGVVSKTLVARRKCFMAQSRHKRADRGEKALQLLRAFLPNDAPNY